ncbi:MAG TPA: succinate dehydrogenase [Casimicrobiaceae bacterium]|nr:succinate dehydrogenase [Casimicrobiaceae bacterium]
MNAGRGMAGAAGERVPGNDHARARTDAALWIAQRASAFVLAACVVVHLATIFYAVRNGLTAAAIIERIHASVAWPAFYVVFVIAAAVHAPIGLRAIAAEWAGFRGRRADLATALVAIALLALGLRAIWGLAA